MKTFLLSLILLMPVGASSDQNTTNLVYPIDDGRLLSVPLLVAESVEDLYARLRHGPWPMNLQRVEEARKMPECWPAKDFPEGNWGPTNAGLQLSLRFTRQTYTNGEPITAILLVRNVTNESVFFAVTQNGLLGGPITFQVISSDGKLMPAREYSHWVMVASPGMLWSPLIIPQSQKRLEEHFNGAYTLTNGTYSVRAVLAVSRKEGKEEVKSAAVPLRIEGDSPATNK